MSADRTVTAGEWGRSKVRCDGFSDGRRCSGVVVGEFKSDITSARSYAASRGWQTAVRTQYAPNGFAIHDYCPEHRTK